MEVIVLCAAFIAVTAVLLVPVALRSRERMALLHLVRTTAESGQPISAEVVHALRGARGTSTSRDLRRGAVLLAIGIALILAGLTSFLVLEHGHASNGPGVVISALGLFPASLGAAFLFLSRADRSVVKD